MTRPFKSIKAMATGAAIGIFVFCGVMVYHDAVPKYATDAQPGSVIVRPIRKDDGAKNLMFAIMLGVAGFYFGTRAIARRLDDKK